MTNKHAHGAREATRTATLDRALQRVLAEIHDGLRHGHFEFVLTCEIVGQDRRRLTLRAGKSYQFLIPLEDCVRRDILTSDSWDGSATTASVIQREASST